MRAAGRECLDRRTVVSDSANVAGEGARHHMGNEETEPVMAGRWLQCGGGRSARRTARTRARAPATTRENEEKRHLVAGWRLQCGGGVPPAGQRERRGR